MRTISKYQSELVNVILGKPQKLLSFKKCSKVGLKIYQDAYFARLIEVLESDFETTRAVCGERVFHKLVDNYLESFGSTSFSIVQISLGFARFCKTQKTLKLKPFLSDLVRLERAVLETFYENEDFQKNLKALNPDLPVLFPKSLSLVPLSWTVVGLWSQKMQGEASVLRHAKNHKNVALIWRTPKGVRVLEISPQQARAIELLRQGKSVAALVESGNLEACFDSEEELSTLFRLLGEESLIRQISANGGRINKHIPVISQKEIV